jgi:hypothetical protein
MNAAAGLTEARAQALAVRLYAGRRDKVGALEFDHVRRVAEELPDGDLFDRWRAIAWMHDAVEDGLATAEFLRREGMDDDQASALYLLTRQAGLTYEAYVQRMAVATGEAGAMARAIKLLDLDDNMTRECPPESLPMREPGGRYARAKQILSEALTHA